jgi:hypothetical protein
MVKGERFILGRNGGLMIMVAATFGRIHIWSIQKGSFTNGGKEDYRTKLGLKQTQLRLRAFGMDKGYIKPCAFLPSTPLPESIL